MDYDPDFYEEEHVFDTFDDISDEPDRPLEDFENPIAALDATAMGMAFAFGAEMADSRKAVENLKDYELTEETDEENMRLAMAMNQTDTEYERMRPFEQYIDDICKGRRKLFGK